MNNANMKAKIAGDKRAIKAAANRANRILRKYPELQVEFAQIMGKAKRQAQLGATPWFEMPVESLSKVPDYWQRIGYVPGSGEQFIFSGLGQNDTPWYERILESDFTSDLVDFGQKIVTHERIAADEQAQLELEIQKIQAKTKELESQEALARALERSGTMTRAVGTTLAENPMALPLLLALGGTLIFMQMKKR